MDKKIANTILPINDLIAKRWSHRAFKKEALDDSIILKITEAARIIDDKEYPFSWND